VSKPKASLSLWGECGIGVEAYSLSTTKLFYTKPRGSLDSNTLATNAQSSRIGVYVIPRVSAAVRKAIRVLIISTSHQTRPPAELKHIIKRRKRKQK
jgi:hypothetical protein